MSRAAEDIQAELLTLLPRGWAWPRSPDSVMGRLLLAAAAELARFEAGAEALLLESDPRSADALLTDYERVLGPDPCGRDAADLSVPARRQLVHQRWTARGGATPAFFIRLAASLGVSIQLDEGAPSVCGGSVCGDSLAPPEARFVWRVRVPPGAPGGLPCVLFRLTPSHTTLVIVDMP